MTFRFLNSKERKEVFEELEDLYGVEAREVVMMEAGKQKIRVFSGDLTREEIMKLNEFVRIEVTGIYFASKKDEEIRLNFDVVSFLRNEISKNVIEIDKENYEKWIRGQDIELKTQRGTIVLKYGNDLIGVGKSNGERVFNYVPKERKLKTPIKV